MFEQGRLRRAPRALDLMVVASAVALLLMLPGAPPAQAERALASQGSGAIDPTGASCVAPGNAIEPLRHRAR